MKAALERLESLHEALISALDANDVAGIEGASRDLQDGFTQLRSSDFTAEPELKIAAERVARLAQAALMRVNVLSDQAKRRTQALAAARGQEKPLLYGR
jgi:hypothetical protein